MNAIVENAVIETANAARVDIYATIHKAIGARMADTLVQAGRVDPTDAVEVAELAATVRGLLAMLEAHLEHENRFVHPAMEAALPGTTARVAGEHREHLQAIRALERDVAALEAAAPALEAGPSPHARVAAARLYRSLAHLVAENIEHMAVEESEHNAVLWSCYSDPDILAIEQAIVGAHSPDEIADVMRWMLPAISAPERAEMFIGMRAGAPAAVFDGMLDLARACLPGRDFAKLTVALG